MIARPMPTRGPGSDGMKTILIAYDLNASGQDYAELHDAIRELARGWWHHLDSLWLIKTELRPVEVRDLLKVKIDENDELLVIDVTGRPRAWRGFNERGSKWLHETFT